MHNLFLYVLLCACATVTVFTKEVAYDLTASYFDGAPDGVPKKILGFNGRFPGPTIRAAKNDILTIKVTNLIQDQQTTTIHWHGLEQYLTPFQDGPRMLTQCDIPYNHTNTYQFEVIQSGTYWYHAHHTSQYAEGLWGVIIIDNTPEVYNYDGEFVLTLSDWFHVPAKEMTAWYHDIPTSKGGMPYPDSGLINGEGYYQCEYANRKNMSCNPSFSERYKLIEVERNKTYRFRIVNPATIVLYAFSIDGHKLQTIETDGVDTIQVPGVDRATISTGTRYSFLVKMDGDLDQYWIRSWADLSTFKLDHPNITPFPEAHRNNPTTLAVLRYKDTVGTTVNTAGSRTNPGAVQGRPEKHDAVLLRKIESGETSLVNLADKLAATEKVDGFQFYEDPLLALPTATAPFPTTNETEEPVTLNYMDCAPYGGHTAPMHVNQSIILYIPHIDDPANTFKPGFNNITYDVSSLDKPALVKMLREETLPESLNPITINGFGEDYVVELIINDYGDSGHPFHLHGHTFWVMGYGNLHDGPFVEERDRPKLRSGVRKETMAVLFDSWLVIRFRADNPGLWLFHCHMNFHFEAAIGLVFLEGAETARKLFADSIPEQTKELCRASGIELEEAGSTTVASAEMVKSQGIFVTLIYLFYIIWKMG